MSIMEARTFQKNQKLPTSQFVKALYFHMFSPPTNLFSDLFSFSPSTTSSASGSNLNFTLEACAKTPLILPDSEGTHARANLSHQFGR